MTLIALPSQGSNITPILDFSSWLQIFHVDKTHDMKGIKLFVKWLTPEDKVNVLVEAHVKTLICGGLSDSLYDAFDRTGINVVWGIMGPIIKVVECYALGALDSSPYRVVGLGAKRFKPVEMPQWPIDAETTHGYSQHTS